MRLFGKYRLGFDIWAIILFLAIMIPNFIWFVVPAPNDVLRGESITGTMDTVASITQAIMIATLCILKNKDAKKKIKKVWVSGTVLMRDYRFILNLFSKGATIIW